MFAHLNYYCPPVDMEGESGKHMEDIIPHFDTSPSSLSAAENGANDFIDMVMDAMVDEYLREEATPR